MNNVFLKILADLEVFNEKTIMNVIPHTFLGGAFDFTVHGCLEWIKKEHKEAFPKNLVPIYGYIDEDYDINAWFLLIHVETGELFEIGGSHCSDYGFQGQFIPMDCPIEYLAKGKKWEKAYDIIVEALKHLSLSKN